MNVIDTKGLRVPGHALTRRDESGVFKALCRCGAASIADLPSHKKRNQWYHGHLSDVLLGRMNSDVDSETLMQRAGISYRQLDYWTRQGYVRAEGKGSGRLRKWSADEQAVAMTMSRLSQAGFTTEAAALIARKHVEEPSVEGTYLLQGQVRIIVAA